jgi:hypothetical protein
MYSFNTTIHARPAAARPGPVVTLRGLQLATLAVAPAEVAGGFARTLEDVLEALGRLDRMFVEPDGSFVWVSPAGRPAWQLDGVVLDREGRVLYVDLLGTCPPEGLDEMLSSLDGAGKSAVRAVFQLRHEALFLDEPEFRRYAAAVQNPPEAVKSSPSI